MSEWISVNERLPLGVGDDLDYAKREVEVKGGGRSSMTVFERGVCKQGPYYSWGKGEKAVGVVHHWRPLANA